MNVVTIIIALLLFGIIILIHEFGHFLLAKKNGVTVHEFSIGMGPQIYGKEKNGTMYSIRLLPIGGYVSMEGEEDGFEHSKDDDEDILEENMFLSESDEDLEKEIDEGSFANKTILQRASIIFAGPFFNFLGCIAFLLVLFLMIGVPNTKVDTVIDNSPAQKIGLQQGDKIEYIDGVKMESSSQIIETISGSNGEELSIVINRDKKDITVNMTPMLNQDTNTYIIGITFQRSKNIVSAFVNSCTTTVDIAKQMIQFLGQLVTGRVEGGISESVAGPVGVISLVSDAAKTGIINLIYLGAVISLNLGIMNLIPFPALDGGRLLLLFIEFIRGGKKLDPNKEAMINIVGMSVLIVFMIFVTYGDILRIFF